MVQQGGIQGVAVFPTHLRAKYPVLGKLIYQAAKKILEVVGICPHAVVVQAVLNAQRRLKKFVRLPAARRAKTFAERIGSTSKGKRDEKTGANAFRHKTIQYPPVPNVAIVMPLAHNIKESPSSLRNFPPIFPVQ
jgi:hypothetical protein